MKEIRFVILVCCVEMTKLDWKEIAVNAGRVFIFLMVVCNFINMFFSIAIPLKMNGFGAAHIFFEIFGTLQTSKTFRARVFQKSKVPLCFS